MGQFNEIIQECLTKLKNTLIYKRFGRNRRMECFNFINGPDEMVHREPFHLSCDRPFLMEGLD